MRSVLPSSHGWWSLAFHFQDEKAVWFGDRLHEGGRTVIKSDQHKIRGLIVCGKC